MEYFSDLYGVRADQETFIKREEEVIRPLAKKLSEILNIEMNSSYSDSRGGICYDIARELGGLDEDEEDDDEYFRKLEELEKDLPPPEIDVHLAPNRIIEPDDDYWLEENYQEFAWLLSIGSPHKERIEEVRQAIAAAKDLDLTLIRSTYNPDLGGEGRRTVTFSLKREAAEE